MKTAWLVLSNDELVDVLSGHYDFDRVFTYATDLYLRSHLSLHEKLSLAHYTRGRKRREEILKSIPVMTSYQTGLYEKMIRAMEKDTRSPESKGLLEKWSKAPQFVRFGHNPSIEVRQVFNLQYTTQDQGAILTYENVKANGDRETITLQI